MKKSLNFFNQFCQLAEIRSPFCLGIDPSAEILTAWSLPDTALGLAKFCDQLVTICGSELAVVKPQSAYFERFGDQGMAVLQKMVAAFQAQNVLVLLDVKRGDIGSTNQAYADALLGQGSFFAANAMTVNPYLGFGSLRPMLDRAKQTQTAVFVVVASSNPEALMLQNAKLTDGRSVAEYLADEIAAYNRDVGDKIVGAVVGATRDDLSSAFYERFDGALLLTPGLGAQGASFADLKQRFQGCRIMPTSARQILKLGPDRVLENIKSHIAQSMLLWMEN